MSSIRPATRVPEERVSAILTRAAELDRNARETVELDAIRTAALEAGISLAAVNLALEEYEAGTATPAPSVARNEAHAEAAGGRMRRWLHKLVRPLKYAALGMILGLLGATGEAAFVIPLFGLLYAAARLVWRGRATGRARAFLACVLAMTVGAVFGFGAPGGDEDALAVLLVTGLALLPAGTAVIKLIGHRYHKLQEIGAVHS